MLKYYSQRFWENIASFKNYVLRNTKYHSLYTTYPGNEVIVGEIPTYQNGILDYLTNNCVTDVLSIVVDEEYLPNLIHTPVPIEKIKQYGIDVWRIYIEDGKSPTPDMINDINFIIDRIIRDRGTLYIHCRSGIGRSPLIATMFFMKRYLWNVDHAVEHVKKYRPEVNFSNTQLEFLEFLRTMENTNKSIKMDVANLSLFSEICKMYPIDSTLDI